MLQTRRTTAWSSRTYGPGGPVRVGGRAPQLFLAALGRFFSTGRFDFQQVARGYAVHVVASGRGVMRVRGVDYHVGAGDVFTFFPGDHVRYHDDPHSPWRYAWFHPEGPLAEAALAQVGVTRSRPHRHGDWATRLEPIFREIETVYVQDHVPATFAVAAAWRLIDALAGGVAEDAPAQGPAAAARFLMDHQDLRDGLTIADAAARLGISRATLFRRFTQEFRIGPKAYLDGLRLDQARKLLRQSDSGLKAISAACGYNSLPQFIRAFHKMYGQSPGAWRRGRRRG